jgi:hypothetical protein
VLVIGLTTVIAGWNEFNGTEDFGKAKESFFRSFLELPHGIPDEKTFARVFSWIEPAALFGGPQTWLMRVNKAGGRTINIDGETICGSACQGRNGVHIVSARVSARNMVLGQVKTGEKSNEITAVPELLDSLDVKGDTISIDAMGCQTDIAAKIREKGANYVLSVKENQPTLYRETNEYFECVEEDWGRNPPTGVWRSGLEEKISPVEGENFPAVEKRFPCGGELPPPPGGSFTGGPAERERSGERPHDYDIVPAQERGKGETHGLQPLLHQ